MVLTTMLLKPAATAVAAADDSDHDGDDHCQDQAVGGLVYNINSSCNSPHGVFGGGSRREITEELLDFRCEVAIVQVVVDISHLHHGHIHLLASGALGACSRFSPLYGQHTNVTSAAADFLFLCSQRNTLLKHLSSLLSQPA
jgi:hypothetical protein